MRLGARWLAGDPPHRGVPEGLTVAIADAEAAQPGAESWTLTWLEGRPVCTLLRAGEAVVEVRLSASGEVVVSPRAAAPGAPGSGSVAGVDSSAADSVAVDTDDDDWLA